MILRKYDDYFLIKIFKDSEVYFDVFNVENMQEFFQFILIKLKKDYELCGLIDAQMYISEDYGIIMELRSLDNYLDNFDIKIKVHFVDNFLVKIDSNCILDYENVYYFEGNFYGIYNKFCDGEVFYKNIDKIINEGIQVC